MAMTPRHSFPKRVSRLPESYSLSNPRHVVCRNTRLRYAVNDFVTTVRSFIGLSSVTGRYRPSYHSALDISFVLLEQLRLPASQRLHAKHLRDRGCTAPQSRAGRSKYVLRHLRLLGDPLIWSKARLTKYRPSFGQQNPFFTFG